MVIHKGGISRLLLLITASAIWMTVGKFAAKISSPVDLIHFTAFGGMIAYLFIFRPTLKKQSIMTCGICLFAMVLIIVSYFFMFVNAVPDVRINWYELPIALYFLTSVYIVLWLLDKFIAAIFSFLCGRIIKNKIIFASAKFSLRTALLVLFVMPYLIAVFITHWVKFNDIKKPASLKGTEYSQVCFESHDGTKLRGWFIAAQNHISDSTIMIVSGRSAAKNLFMPHTQIFTNAGYNVLLYDLRGNGESDGHKYSYAVYEGNDVMAGLDFLQTQKPQSSRYIFGYGINEGAAAVIAAAAADERFAAVVSDNASGYDIIFPHWMQGYLPRKLENYFLTITKTFVHLDIGKPIWGMQGIDELIPQISPCPVLLTNSIKNNKYNRMNTIELFSKAREPKKLWLAPQKADSNTYDEYFMNVFETFQIGKAKKQSGNWRTSRIFAN